MVFAKFWPGTLLFRHHFKIHYLGWYAYGRQDKQLVQGQTADGRVAESEELRGVLMLHTCWAGLALSSLQIPTGPPCVSLGEEEGEQSSCGVVSALRPAPRGILNTLPSLRTVPGTQKHSVNCGIDDSLWSLNSSGLIMINNLYSYGTLQFLSLHLCGFQLASQFLEESTVHKAQEGLSLAYTKGLILDEAPSSVISL